MGRNLGDWDDWGTEPSDETAEMIAETRDKHQWVVGRLVADERKLDVEESAETEVSWAEAENVLRTLIIDINIEGSGLFAVNWHLCKVGDLGDVSKTWVVWITIPCMTEVMKTCRTALLSTSERLPFLPSRILSSCNEINRVEIG